MSNTTTIQAGERTHDISEMTNFIATTRFGFGIAQTAKRAVALAKQNTPYGKRVSKSEIKIYRAHPDTTVFGDGSWEYPTGCAPILCVN